MEFLEVIEIFENRLNNADLTPTQRTACLATTALKEEDFPPSRMVILREFNPADSSILVYTHTLSNKVQELAANPNSTILWYDPAENLQIQFSCYGRIELNQDRIIHHRNSLRSTAHKDYIGPKPGSPYQEESTVEQAQELQFCLLHFEIQEMTVLKLAESGHQKFSYAGFPDQVVMQRLVP